MTKTCIVIAGPTAVGKTTLAIRMAQYFSTDIISADSRQCYKELNIGVAKPSEEVLFLIHHYFINSFSISDLISAADFEKYALASINKIFEQRDVAIMVGGTGLYIRSFCEGLDDIPGITDEVKKIVADNYAAVGIEWLQEQLNKNDPEYFQKGEILNPQRMMRALEVVLTTGKSILSFQKNRTTKRDFNIIKIGLELPREDLYNRINKRVDEMVASGLVAEVESLIPYKSFNALQTVGYRELFDYFEGKNSLDNAINLIKQNTRHYAKRQMTWFKKDTTINWVDMRNPDQAIDSIKKIIK
jgi:tRNA dimethylallyltransferase